LNENAGWSVASLFLASSLRHVSAGTSSGKVTLRNHASAHTMVVSGLTARRITERQPGRSMVTWMAVLPSGFAS
jgi:hypothetical protein